MLVLSRKRDEKIHVGHGVVIQVIDIRGDKVRLGIEADKSVPVHRGEIYEAIYGNGSNVEGVPGPAAAG